MARYADKASLPPIRNERESMWQKEDLRKKIPLFLKFESLIVFMYRRTLDLQNKNLSRVVENGLFP